jgi:uncharacterized membrane protein YhhN
MLLNSLLGLALVLAIGDWIAAARRWRIAEYILKPAVMLAILAWLGLEGGFSGWMIWFSLGVFFSLVGDVALFGQPKKYIVDLAAFFIALVSYTIGFNPGLPPLNLASLALALMVALPAITIYLRVASEQHRLGQAGMLLPSLAYTIAISLMTLSALLTLLSNEWQSGPALLVSAGALLFFLSDAIRAWNQFVSPLKHGRITCRIAYHLGQLLIVFGASLHYL